MLARPFTARVDLVVLHKYLGFPIFLSPARRAFRFDLLGGAAVHGLIDWSFRKPASSCWDSPVRRRLPFLAEGILGGVGAVAVFFPQIVILFFLMTLLEDSGYLARGAALVDRPLSYLGLHGRSFVPMLSGYACAIPAVLAARTIPSKRERLLTIWIIPLMSCSARLPV